MNNEEAKFILAAYRHDGRDAADVRFAEAIAQAERDPELRAWWERQRAFDAAVAAKLAAVAPPPGLRESILAGGRVSQLRRRWWRQPAWLAAAAALVLLGALAVTLGRFRGAPTLTELSRLALRDLDVEHDRHNGFPPGLDGVQAQLAGAALPLPQNVRLDLAELSRKRCRAVTLAGREVFELCFHREGVWFHLYVARRSDFAPDGSGPRSLLTALGDHAATAWADSDLVYALVTEAGAAALRRVI